ncbi:MAG: sigma-70 family RNA polymerase sigma factor [Ruminococcus sp.]|nr:sigma-70 family RNA polymerase sigma factor [Ruminococcus sp.]
MNTIEELYNEYFHDIYLYLMSLSHSEDTASELTQETFFRAMRSVDKFRGDCDVRVWLCQIAKNAFLSQCRKDSRFTGEEVPETVPDTSVSIEDSLADKERSMAIHQILHDMNDPHKEVFTLRVFGELSFRQIGGLFGKTESWARVTFHRAKLMIISRLEESE